MDKIKKILWSNLGLSSLNDIISYIAKDSDLYASNFAKRMLERIEILKTFPQIGRVVPEYNNPRIREIIYQNYRVVYKINDDLIIIVYIGHGARELPSLH